MKENPQIEENSAAESAPAWLHGPERGLLGGLGDGSLGLSEKGQDELVGIGGLPIQEHQLWMLKVRVLAETSEGAGGLPIRRR